MDRLEFTAGVSTNGPLTWAQSVMWDALRFFGKEAGQFNITQAIVLPGPMPEDAVRALLRRVIEQHETLRTRYLDSPDGPRQHVHATGSYELTAVGDQGDPARVIDELRARLSEAAFDHDAEWPLRVGCAVDRQGRITAVTLIGSHLAFDGYALAALVEQLSGAVVPAGPAPQPLEQAAFQHSPAGQQQSRLGVQHWEKALATAPASMFDLPRHPTGDRPIERHQLDSAAVAAAATMLAARTRTSFATVLLGLTTVVLSAYTGHDTVALKLIAGNRLDRRSRELIALNTLDALLVHRVQGDDLLAAIQAAHRPAVGAYRRAPCDPRAVAAAIAGAGRRRGVSFDLSAYFNTGHGGNEWPEPDPGLDQAGLARLRAGSVYERLEPVSKSDMKFMAAAGNLGDGRCRLGLLVDTAYFPGASGETILYGLERILCAAVTEEIPVTEVADRIGLSPAARGPEWTRTGVGWIRPADVTGLVREAAGGAPAAVFATDRGVTAYVVTGTPTDVLHQRVLDLLPGRTGVAAPDDYVRCGSAPAAGAGPAEWEAARTPPVT